jgi:hypothetical protein
MILIRATRGVHGLDMRDTCARVHVTVTVGSLLSRDRVSRMIQMLGS